MMMDAMTTMDDVSTALLGCGGGRRNARVIPRVEETTRGFLITVNAPGARAEDVREGDDGRARGERRFAFGSAVARRLNSDCRVSASTCARCRGRRASMVCFESPS